MKKRALARAAALLGAATVSAGVLVGVAAPAMAASLGDVVLSETSGSVSASPMFAEARSSACPQGYGENANLRVGRPGGPYSNLAPVLGGGGYDEGPVTINPNRSFTAALGGAPGEGEWWIVMECYSLTEGRHVDEFRTSIVVSGDTWRVPVAEETATSLAVAPAGPVDQGAEVTLTATVTPANAAGTVEFRRGANVLGSAPVSDGVATFATTALPVGTVNLSAAFSPSDATAFKASASGTVPFTVNQPAGAISTDVEIVADVDPGAFSLAVASPTTSLAGGTVGGTATGALPAATVTDLRGTNLGWNLTGQLADFASAGNTIASGNLSWNPSAAKTSGSGAVTAGAAANLGDTRTLCSATLGTSAGVFTCGADLSLSIPDDVPPGEYAATLTLTLA
ncbi:Ig-like domain repeat protein [Rhizomonospora bruguierae]|uniref:Ig-like domain repeat protein n=1 Tax=Rhizomonospora bruguierae TaxID=1581705 RepID=UPI001BCFF7E1|nr:Ig-like domain repeat protein [Micromonospora sp. NBRC 107566]